MEFPRSYWQRWMRGFLILSRCPWGYSRNFGRNSGARSEKGWLCNPTLHRPHSPTYWVCGIWLSCSCCCLLLFVVVVVVVKTCVVSYHCLEYPSQLTISGAHCSHWISLHMQIKPQGFSIYRNIFTCIYFTYMITYTENYAETHASSGPEVKLPQRRPSYSGGDGF